MTVEAQETTEVLPLDPEPWAWQIGGRDAHTHRFANDGMHGWTRFRPRDGYEQDPVEYGIAADWVDFDPLGRPTTQRLRDGSEVGWYAERPYAPDQWVPCPSESVARDFVAWHASSQPNLRVALRTVVVHFQVIDAEH